VLLQSLNAQVTLHYTVPHHTLLIGLINLWQWVHLLLLGGTQQKGSSGMGLIYFLLKSFSILILIGHIWSHLNAYNTDEVAIFNPNNVVSLPLTIEMFI